MNANFIACLIAFTILVSCDLSICSESNKTEEKPIDLVVSLVNSSSSSSTEIITEISEISSSENETEISNNRDSKLLTLTSTEDELLMPAAAVDELLLDSSQNLKEKAIENLMKIFGITSNSSIAQRDLISSQLGPAPEFMIDLYNTITDSSGVTRARNPYNAHIVRSYIEKDNSLNDYFFFNVSVGMGSTESILESELHLHRMKTSHEDLHPSLYLTPFYILSLYQVVDPKSLHIPDLHKLLGVNYVPALGSGWEVFNVKQAVLEWTKGERANHGFLIAATSLSGDRVPVRFSRRGETKHHSKQPILVLFNEDAEMSSLFPTKAPPQMTNGKNGKKFVNSATQKNETSSLSENEESNEQLLQIPTSSLENPRFHHSLLYKDSIRHPNSIGRFRSRRSKNATEPSPNSNDNSSNTVNSNTANNMSPGSGAGERGNQLNFTECGRHDLFVSFESIGWSSWIISPKGYNAFYCDGPCRFPLGQQVKPTNHATVQSIVYELKLSTGIGRPCCVPTSLLPISLLFYDDHDNVVLKQYVDMVAESCGCH